MFDSFKERIKQVKLENGLNVILYEDKSLPLVTVNLWYNVGSSSEVPGKTGLAHLFEHMMFQGSENVEKEMHFKYIQEAGGSLNASTSLDRTNYFETLPSNNLELALWLEADRMGGFLPALNEEKFENQRSVVMNERRQRYDNQPYGLAIEILFSNLFPGNIAYHWPTIGWMQDIENYTLEDVKDFFTKFYSPSNASIVVAGDIETKNDETLNQVVKYFKGIEQPETGISFNRKQNKYDFPLLKETKEIIHKDNVQLERLYIVWQSDRLYDEDDAALDVISEILGGSKNSRLQKNLVFEKQLVLDISCFQYSAHLTGMFLIVATIKPGISSESVKKEIYAEINKLAENGCTGEEFSRAKNGIKSGYVFSLQKVSTIADAINNYNKQLGSPDSFGWDLDRFDKLNVDDITSITKKYLQNHYVELRVIPK